MFENISMTGTGLVLLVLNVILYGLDKFIGIHINVLPDQLTQFVDNATQVVSFVLMIWGQVRRPDLVGGILRVEPRK